MTPILFLLVAWGVLDVVFVGAVSYVRSVRRRSARDARVLRLCGVGETSAPAPITDRSTTTNR